MPIDYRILYRNQVSEAEFLQLSHEWSLFLSAFNDSMRVQSVFDACKAGKRHWLVHDEYRFSDAELPEEYFRPETLNEAEFWQGYEAMAGSVHPDSAVCVDTTGFMRPHLAFLMAWLFKLGIRRFYGVYSDPVHYTKQEKTEFSKGPVVDVRQVAGFEGIHVPETHNDLVIIGAGYDDELIRRVAEHKANARKVQLFGLPSLEPDMYQESVVRADRAAEAVSAEAEGDRLFAPASDPFVTAQVLKERVQAEEAKEPLTNLYLTSLGTKPQMLGFALYFLTERAQTATSLLFPYAKEYSRETTQGIARIWLYTVELLSDS